MNRRRVQIIKLLVMQASRKLIEEMTSLLIYKIQFDRRFDALNEIIQSEQWEAYEQLKTSVDHGLILAGKMEKKLAELRKIIN